MILNQTAHQHDVARAVVLLPSRGDGADGGDSPGAGPDGATRPVPPAGVLIVEDEAIIAWELSNMVEDLGYQVLGTAANTVEAIRQAEALAPDLILMDVRLSRGDDGIATADAIRARRDVPIVFCTAYAQDPGTAARIATLGAAGVLSKPVRAHALAPLLRKVLGPG